MKRKFLFISTLFFICFTSASYAWTDNSSTNWDMPNSGSVSGEEISTDSGQRFQTLIEDFYWDSNKLQNMLDSDYFPTFDVHEDGAPGNVDGIGAWTTLPASKVDVEDDAWYEGDFDNLHEEIEVVVTDPSQLSANTQYDFGAVWEVVTQDNSAMIAYSSQSKAPLFSSGDYNTVSGTIDFLGSHYKNDVLGTTSQLIGEESLSLDIDENTHIADNSVSLSEQYKAYRNISNMNDLQSFKHLANKTLSESLYDDPVYMITFSEPIPLNEAKKIMNSNNFGNSNLLYARAYNNEGRKVTIIAEDIDGIELISSSQNMDLKGIIQVHGKEKMENLNSISKNSKVFTIEVKTDNWVPVGLYSKLEQMKLDKNNN